MKKCNWFYIVCVALLSGSCATSHQSLKEVAALSDAQHRKFDYFFQESLRQKEQQAYDAAFDLMKKAASIDTTSAPAHFELANYYIQLGRPLVALDYLQKANYREPDNYWYGMMQGQLQLNLNMSEEAEATYKRLASIYPENPEINYARANLYTQRGETRNAIQALDELEKNVGVMEPVILEKHRLYMSLKEPDSAFAEVNKLITAYPSDIQYRIMLGDLYLNAGMIPEADKAYEQAAKMDPNNAYLLVSRADYFNRIGNIPASNQLVKSALINEKLDVDTKVKILTGYLSTLLQKKESLAETDSLFTIVLDQHPQESKLRALYAELLMTTERYKDAHEQLEFAVDFAPNDSKLWLQLVGISLNQKDYQDVVDVTTRAIKYLPQMPELYLYQGVAYSLLEKPKKALATYQLALSKVDKKNVQMISDLWGQIGDVYHKMGDSAKSYQAYDEALKYNDKNIGVLNNYSYFLSLDKSDLSKAERMAGQVVKLQPENATYLDTYAWIYFQQGNYMLAKFYIQSAVDKNKEPNAEILEHYGDILFKNDDVEGAVEQWKKALEVAKETEPTRDVRILKKKIETKTYIEK